jgi:4-amino-4-deoxy-L-arabinose transferase-like glycosyltransferase
MCFLVRGFFYSSLFPLWEGYDEFSHFAYVQHLAVQGELPVLNQTRVSREVHESVRLVPLPWMLGELPPPHVTHDAYWQLPAEERKQRQQQFRALSPEWASQPAPDDLGFFWEAQQPPLYYWLFSWPLRLAAGSELSDRVMLLRWLSVGFASLVIPLGFLLARRVFGEDGPALGSVALVAAMPELMVDICRVGNESPAIVLYTLLLYFTLKMAEGPERVMSGWLLGLILGLGLLTKAYFLAALPALALTYAWRWWRWPGERRKIVLHGAVASAVAVLLAGWWYRYNLLLTGSLTGQGDDAALGEMPLLELLGHVAEVDWYHAADSIFFSHIWFGNWSFLQVRSWMYHSFRTIILLAIVGLAMLVWRLWRKQKDSSSLPSATPLLVLAAFYGFFWMGLAYHILVTFVNRGLSASTGWYMYSLVMAEVLLATLGLFALCPARWRRWILPAGTGLFVLLELYATHLLLIPYYTGLIAHKPNGHLASFYVSQLREVGLGTVLERLLVNKPAFLSEPVLVVLWLLFLAATVGLVALSVRASQKRSTCVPT